MVEDDAWTHAQDDEGIVVRKVAKQEGAVWDYAHDLLNRLISAELRDLIGGNLITRVTYRYDALGNSDRARGHGSERGRDAIRA